MKYAALVKAIHPFRSFQMTSIQQRAALQRQIWQIAELNAELASTVAKTDRLRADIDAIVVEIEGGRA